VAKNLELITYIYNNLQQGYPLDSIKKQLISQGFSGKEIDQSVDFVYANYFHQDNATMKKNYPDYQTPKGKKIGVNNIVILILIIFGVSLIGFALVFILSSGGDTDTSVIPDEVPSAVIPDENPNVVIPDAVIPNETPVIDDTPEVLEPEDTPDVIEPVVDDDYVDLQTKIMDPFQGAPIEEGFNEGEGYTHRQIELKVAFFKEENPAEALRFCGMYSEIKENYCVIEVAVASERVDYCEKVSDSRTKDDCYLEIILTELGDALTCESISNTYKKNTCKTLIKMRTMTPEQFASGNSPEDAINAGNIISDIS